MLKVGVLLPRLPEDLGRWLALGASFDAAGADALWVDVAASEEIDPFALTAALAAVTHRSLLVMTLVPDPPKDLARRLATIDLLSRGRLREVPGEKERWIMAPMPDNRAAWHMMVIDATDGGVHGLVVPAEPRMLDLLRNPDDPGERRDLELAVG